MPKLIDKHHSSLKCCIVNKFQKLFGKFCRIAPWAFCDYCITGCFFQYIYCELRVYADRDRLGDNFDDGLTRSQKFRFPNRSRIVFRKYKNTAFDRLGAGFRAELGGRYRRFEY